MSRMLPRRFLALWFALALLLGQATAFAHALGHLHKDDGGGLDPVCEVCVAQAHLGHAACGAPVHLPPLAQAAVTLDPPSTPLATLHPTAAYARGPPISA
jgi:hypothetical protein